MWMIYSRYTVSVTRRIGHTLALDSPQKIDRVIVIARNFASWQKKEHSNQHTEALRQESRGTMDGDQLLPVASGDDSEDQSRKKPQFGTRFLTDPKNVFQHNAWDNVVWDEEQEKEARQKTQEQLQNALSVEKQEEYEREADQYWDKFYSQHQNRFFKDRHWLFTEFPELYSSRGNTVRPPVSQKPNETPDDCAVLEQACSGEATAAAESVEANRNRDSLDDGGLKTVSDAAVSRTDESLSEKASHLSLVKDCVTMGEPGHKTEDMTASAEESSELVNNSVDAAEENSDCVISQEQGKTTHSVTAAARSESFPGESATFRVFEVGCGVGNTVFPVLYTNNDPGLMMYCCDFSSTAVQLVKENRDYDSKRCHAFVWDITDENSPLPFPPESLDIIIMIFVLSAVHPDKMQQAVDRLASCLKPGGMILLRDYGRYDMAQLRFKKGRCLGENFYVRGDGTRVYFFTQEEFRNMFQKAGLQEVQNLIDRRLQVNRGRQIKMYRVWIQCKYRKPLKGDKREDDVEKGLPMS